MYDFPDIDACRPSRRRILQRAASGPGHLCERIADEILFHVVVQDGIFKRVLQILTYHSLFVVSAAPLTGACKQATSIVAANQAEKRTARLRTTAQNESSPLLHGLENSTVLS